MDSDEITDKKKALKPKRSGRRFISYLILTPVAIIFLCTLLIQIPTVQSFIVHRITYSISKDLKTKVTIDKVKLNVFKGLELKGIYVEDLKGDTLLYGNSLASSFRDNIISLINKRLILREINLSGASVYIHRAEGDTLNNLAILLSNLEMSNDQAGKRVKKQPLKPFYLEIEEVNLHHVRMVLMDEVKRLKEEFSLVNGNISIDQFNLQSNEIKLEALRIDKPVIKITILEDADTTDDISANLSERTKVIDENTDTLFVFCARAEITDGKFILDNYRSKDSTIYESSIDYNHMRISDISMNADSILFNTGSGLEMHHFSATLLGNNEFEIKEVSGDKLIINSRRSELQQALIRTEKSEVRDHIVFKYRKVSDWSDFVDKVIMELNISKSKVSIGDLVYFAPILNLNEFFNKNKSDLIQLSGEFAGRVNSLSGRDINLRIGKKIIILGDFNSRNLSMGDEAIVNAGIKKLSTHFSVLPQLIPGFRTPDNFYKLGNISFQGRFDGYFQDFVAFGDLQSDIGKAKMDMRLDIKEGRSQASYSGNLNLKAFDLGAWTGDSDFKTIDFSSTVENGKGLTLETVSAQLGADVYSFYYKGYHYQDLSLNGKLQKNLFDGQIAIEDENIDLDFIGTVDFIDSIPAFNFKADVGTLKLEKLHLTSQDYQVAGLFDVSLKGNKIDLISGSISGNSIYLSNGSYAQELDSINVKADQVSIIKSIQFYSDILQGNLIGNFQLSTLPDAFIRVLKVNYPEYTSTLKYISEDSVFVDSNFGFDLLIVDSEKLFSFLTNKSIRIKSLLAKGRIDDRKGIIETSFESPSIEFQQFSFLNTKSRLFSESKNGVFNFRLDSIISGDNKIDPFQIISRTSGDSLIFDLQARKLYDAVENLVLSGMIVHDVQDKFKLSLSDSHFEMLSETWVINMPKPIKFGDRYIGLEGLNISDGSKRFVFSDVNEKGISCSFKNIPFSIVNDFVSMDKLQLSGMARGEISLENVFSRNGLNIALISEDFKVNGDSFGELRIRAKSADSLQLYNYSAKLALMDQFVSATGTYHLGRNQNDGELAIQKYPLNILEYFIGEGGISKTEGVISGILDFSGPLDKPYISGYGSSQGAKTHIDYLGVSYRFLDGNFKVTPELIDFTGMQMLDSEGNTAKVYGGLRHKYLQNLKLDVSIQSPRFVALNTKKSDNPSFYGYGVGEMQVDFAGPFDNVYIDVIATTGSPSRLSIPVQSSSEEVDQSFIEFINSSDINKENNAEIQIEGLNLNMNLEITDDAEVTIIFDENANDILRSRGRGGIQLEINPQGDFLMFGQYEVEGGEYLFTLPFVNKPFSLNNGGAITWTGDPLNAQLAVDADYQDLTAPLDVFLAEYLAGNPDLEQAAKRETEVALTMKLTGTLLAPTIKFDLGFPNVSGDLKSYTDSKLRTLKSDETALYDQVFSLIVFQTFLPSANPFQLGTEQIIGTTYNTFSEFASNQISILLSSLLAEALVENGYWSDIDLQLGVSKNTGLFSNNSLLPDEVNFQVVNRFNNDKWSFNIGGDYVREDPLIEQPYLKGNFVLEYFLTENRRLKLRMYGKLDYDEIELQRKQKVGLGINYRKEFNSILGWRKINSSADSQNVQ